MTTRGRSMATMVAPTRWGSGCSARRSPSCRGLRDVRPVRQGAADEPAGAAGPSSCPGRRGRALVLAVPRRPGPARALARGPRQPAGRPRLRLVAVAGCQVGLLPRRAAGSTSASPCSWSTSASSSSSCGSGLRTRRAPAPADRRSASSWPSAGSPSSSTSPARATPSLVGVAVGAARRRRPRRPTSSSPPATAACRRWPSPGSAWRVGRRRPRAPRRSSASCRWSSRTADVGSSRGPSSPGGWPSPSSPSSPRPLAYLLGVVRRRATLGSTVASFVGLTEVLFAVALRLAAARRAARARPAGRGACHRRRRRRRPAGRAATGPGRGAGAVDDRFPRSRARRLDSAGCLGEGRCTAGRPAPTHP